MDNHDLKSTELTHPFVLKENDGCFYLITYNPYTKVKADKMLEPLLSRVDGKYIDLEISISIKKK